MLNTSCLIMRKISNPNFFICKVVHTSEGSFLIIKLLFVYYYIPLYCWKVFLFEPFLINFESEYCRFYYTNNHQLISSTARESQIILQNANKRENTAKLNKPRNTLKHTPPFPSK